MKSELIKMKWHTKHWVALILSILFSTWGGHAQDSGRKILIISSYSSDYQWSNDIIDGIGIELKKTFPAIEINVEYLSTERYLMADSWVDRLNLSLDNYNPEILSAIILIADEAWMSYRKARIQRFRNTPIFLCGVKPHSITLDQFRDKRDSLTLDDFIPTTELLSSFKVGGVLREMNISRYISFMNELIPGLDQYTLITDNRFYGIYTRLLVEDYLKKEYPEKPVTYLDARFISTDSLLKVLPRVPLTSGVLMTSWLTGESGFEYSKEHRYNMIESALRVPIFITNNIGITTDRFLGGYYSESKFWGDKLANILVQSLNSNYSGRLPIETYIEEDCYINWRVAKKYGVDEHLFPSSAIIINKPDSPWKVYKVEIVFSSIILLLFLLASINILFSNISLKKARIQTQKAIEDTLKSNQDLIKTQEELTVALEKAKEADYLKFTFLNSMQYEIRTPLNTIVGFSDLIGTLEERSEIEEAARQISRDSQRLLKLINNVLDLSLIESGNLEIKYEQIEVKGMIMDLVNLYREKAPKEIKIEYVLPEKRVFIKSNSIRLSQVLSNLMDNAVKFTPKGKIEAGCIINSDDCIEIYVKDTGIGIKDKEKGLVFDHFYKGDPYSRGTGIGLSLSQKIIEILGGEIGFTSEEDVGSRFWIRVPKNPTNKTCDKASV